MIYKAEGHRNEERHPIIDHRKPHEKKAKLQKVRALTSLVNNMEVNRRIVVGQSLTLSKLKGTIRGLNIDMMPSSI